MYGYEYDPVGNRLNQIIDGDTTAYLYDAANRLESVNGQSYTYDNNGNLLNTGVLTNVFDAANRLILTSWDDQTMVLSYNGINEKVAQTVDGVTTHFALDMEVGLSEVIYTDAGNAYLHLAEVKLAESVTGEQRYLLGDALGSIRQAVDETATVVTYNEFDPYGNPVHTGDSDAPYGYTGEWWEDDIGLLYLRSRWYMPETGRFINQDTWEGEQEQPQTLHLYTYVHNNPVNFIDPSGQWREPTYYERQAINLDQVWLVGNYKPQCCEEYINPCQEDVIYETNPNSLSGIIDFPLMPEESKMPNEQCLVKTRTGVNIRENFDQFSSADDYMRYWLAWEIANPCNYRAEANCIGAAMAVSSLYKNLSGTASIMKNRKYVDELGYGNIHNWYELPRLGYFSEIYRQQMSTGDVAAYSSPTWAYLGYFDDKMEGYRPNQVTHMTVATTHQMSGQRLCFEKQGTKLYYQLRYCDDTSGYEQLNEYIYTPNASLSIEGP